MEFEIIAEHLIWTDVGYGNSVAIDLGEKVFVIDSMFNWELTKEWRSTVEKHFRKPVSLVGKNVCQPDAVIIHPNSSGTLMPQLKSPGGIPFISSPAETNE